MKRKRGNVNKHVNLWRRVLAKWYINSCKLFAAHIHNPAVMLQYAKKPIVQPYHPTSSVSWSSAELFHNSANLFHVQADLHKAVSNNHPRFFPCFFCLLLLLSQRITLRLHALKHKAAFLLDTWMCNSSFTSLYFGGWDISGPTVSFSQHKELCLVQYLLENWHISGCSST